MMKVSGMRALLPMSKVRGDHPANAEPPRVQAENDKQRIAAGGLNKPQRIGDESDETSVMYLVESAAGGVYAQSMGATAKGEGYRWKVSIHAWLDGNYEEACECGQNASGKMACKHVWRVVMASKNVRHPTTPLPCSCSCICVEVGYE
jgi:hypothetical protein